MRSSDAAGRLAVLLLAAVLGGPGCAATVRRGEPPAAAPAPDARAGAGPGAAAPPAAPDRAPGAPGASGRLDPSEEITSEELASIPEPVPVTPSNGVVSSQEPSEANGGLKGPSPRPMDSVAPAASETPSGSPGETSPGAGERGWSWRVQIFASESADEAERVAREAEAKLGDPADVVREGSLYKVRLGRFAREGAAQALRDRAVEAGYPGAFRTKTH